MTQQLNEIWPHWPAVFSIAAGIFVIVTTEILPIGLLVPISGAFAVSTGTAGLMMTVPGLVAAVAAPVATVATAQVDRRTMLGVWMVTLVGANVVCAVATEFWTLLTARILVGVVIGGFWSIGAGLAGRLVGEHSVPRATSTIFLAVPLGSVIGVPLGTFIADAAGWRATFAVLAVATALVCGALWATVPALPPRQVTRPAVLAALLARREVRIGLLVTALVVVAHFGAYTYVSAFLNEVAGMGLTTVSALLLGYGAAGLAGNLVAGFTIRRHLRATFAAAALLIAVATLALDVFGHDIIGATAPLLLWGFAYGAVPACSQSLLARGSGGADEAATVLFTSSFQATICLGALLGGLVVDHGSLSLLMALAAVTALGAVAVLAATGRHARARLGNPIE
jgi:predicted MFS family arabinose efflux permease